MLGQPVQGNIGRDDGCIHSVLVFHGHGVGGHHDIAAPFIQIRLAPVAVLILQGLGKPRVGGIIVLRRSQRGNLHLVPVLMRVGSPKRELLAVAGDQGYRGAGNGLVVLYNPGRYAAQAVRILQAPAGNPHIVADGLFGLFHHIQNGKTAGGQDVLRRLAGSLLGGIVQFPELEDGGSLQNGGRHKHQKNPEPFSLIHLHILILRISH